MPAPTHHWASQSLGRFGDSSQWKSSLSAWSLRQQGVQNFRAIAKIRSLEAWDRRCQVDQPTPGGKIKHAECARHGQAEAVCHRDSGTVIHKNKIGSDGNGERDSSTLTFIQSGFIGIVGGIIGVRSNFKPGGTLIDPTTYRRWGFCV
jgi:hypothetical protein